MNTYRGLDRVKLDHTDEPADDAGDDIGDDTAFDVEGAFGEHDIEYWVPYGNRLMPATPEQIAVFREREALPRLARWKRLEEKRQETAQARPGAARVRLRWLVDAGKTLVRRIAGWPPLGMPLEGREAASERQDADTSAAQTDAGRLP